MVMHTRAAGADLMQVSWFPSLHCDKVQVTKQCFSIVGLSQDGNNDQEPAHGS
jgi:hypothetical protein